MNALSRRPFFLLALLLGGLLLAQPVRAEDPPIYDILGALHLEPREDVSDLASANSLPCTVGEGSPLQTFAVGDAVFLMSFDRGVFYVAPNTQALVCCVHETVHLLDFVSPRRALVALGLEPSDEPIPDGARRSTRVADPERLAAHGISCDGVGALVSVYGRPSGRWSISTFGREPGSVKFDAWALYAPRAPLGDTLERATVALDLGTLTEGGRVLARVADPARLASRGIRAMPAGGFVRLARGPGTTWTLTTLSPGFSVMVELEAPGHETLGLEALGLEDPRLEELPVGGSVRGRLAYAWKAAKLGFLKGARGRDPVEVVRQRGGGYLLRDLEPKRPISMVLESE